MHFQIRELTFICDLSDLGRNESMLDYKGRISIFKLVNEVSQKVYFWYKIMCSYIQ